jgi:hypothetical protein
MMQGMVIDMEEARLQTLAQVKAFLDGQRRLLTEYPRRKGTGLSSVYSSCRLGARFIAP